MSKIVATTLEDRVSGDAVPAERLINGACTAWVNFNGTGTVAIRDSYNVASITDNAAGDYTVNFTTDMDTASYFPIIQRDGSASNNYSSSFTAQLVGSVTMFTLFGAAQSDSGTCGCAIIGGRTV